MPVYRAETKFSTKKAGYSALSCVTAIQFQYNTFADSFGKTGISVVLFRHLIPHIL